MYTLIDYWGNDKFWKYDFALQIHSHTPKTHPNSLKIHSHSTRIFLYTLRIFCYTLAISYIRPKHNPQNLQLRHIHKD